MTINNITFSRLLSIFLVSFAIILAFFPEFSFSASTIDDVFNESQKIMDSVLNGIKNILRILCIIGLIFLIWKYANNKVSWEEVLKYGLSLILIGLSNEIVGALIGY